MNVMKELVFTEEERSRIRQDLKYLFPLLQTRLPELDLNLLREAAIVLKLSPILVYTAYQEFLKKEEDLLLICNNITCMGKGAGLLIRYLQGQAGAEVKWESITCLGSCGSGPCVRYQGRILSQMNKQKLKELMHK